jgi:cellobiose phosphorylase
MTIQWKIENLKHRENDGYVESANVKIYFDDESSIQEIYLDCSWNDGQINVAYEKLTENVVLGWVWQSVDKEFIEHSLLIQSQEHQKLKSGLPWANN